MADEGIGSLVLWDDDIVFGIMTERSCSLNVILKGKSSLETPVRDIMEARVACVRTDQTIEQCMAIITDKRIRHLPVVDRKRGKQRLTDNVVILVNLVNVAHK